MAQPSSENYIPTGALRVLQSEAKLDDDVWNSDALRSWRHLSPALVKKMSNPQAFGVDTHWMGQALPLSIQDSILSSPVGQGLRKLLNASWIRLEFQVGGCGCPGTIRVYLLPDDVDRRLVDRSDPKLTKSRGQILNQLDYSARAWNGEHSHDPVHGPLRYEAAGNGFSGTDQKTLLDLFNSIPSPSPSPQEILDPFIFDAMTGLLDSKIPGLITTLYDYQRRSSSLMLQRESNPGKVIDPRLVPIGGQDGKVWYFDGAAGQVLKDPRFYDGVSGGILAEEMGSGKTLICLSLILATRHIYSRIPEMLHGEYPKLRKRVGSLADMAAACITHHSVPWMQYFGGLNTEASSFEYRSCVDAIHRNPGYYYLSPEQPRRASRRSAMPVDMPRKPVYLSRVSLVIVPNNLAAQWGQEIKKHTVGLKVLAFNLKTEMRSVEELLDCDILLFAQNAFEQLERNKGVQTTPLGRILFKRCIVDEGHRLGNSKIGRKSNLLLGLEKLHISCRWIVTGTPAQGLFGVSDTDNPNMTTTAAAPNPSQALTSGRGAFDELEMADLARIGSITTLYLGARPWANTDWDHADRPASWTQYMMDQQHDEKTGSRRYCLATTLNCLIIRHKLSEVKSLLPTVEEKVTVLEGSYQDKLSMNLFSMMIVLNAVQSQRTDMDYFFHARNRKHLLLLVSNLKLASFFGGSFFSAGELQSALDIGEKFLAEKKDPIPAEEESLMREALGVCRLALSNHLWSVGNTFHEVPLHVTNFPGEAGEAWSLDGRAGSVNCVGAGMLLALQRLFRQSMEDEATLNSLFNGGLIAEGRQQRARALKMQETVDRAGTSAEGTKVRAGNTSLGDDRVTGKRRAARTSGARRDKGTSWNSPTKITPTAAVHDEEKLPEQLTQTRIISTSSAKLSYLIDSVLRYQEEDQIIIFYDNETIAFYLAEMFDLLPIRYLIYDKSSSLVRKNRYILTFNHNPDFRVLLMDISRAAFGLDMRAASRIYFLSPVLNPQVEAQAIGRARRISQQKPVKVETLVLKDSLDEVIISRRRKLTQAEHRNIKSILDDRPIYNWILNAKFIPLPAGDMDDASQMAPLRNPQMVFGKGFGRIVAPDDGLLVEGPGPLTNGEAHAVNGAIENGTSAPKRLFDDGPGAEVSPSAATDKDAHDTPASRPARRVRFGDL